MDTTVDEETLVKSSVVSAGCNTEIRTYSDASINTA